jgi:hypothetical protein
MSALEIFPGPGAERALWLLVLRATLVLLAGAGVAWLLRRGSAASRHAVWTSTAIGLLALPVLSLLLPRWELAVLPSASPSASTVGGRQDIWVSDVVLPPRERAAVAPRATHRLSIAGALVIAWALGAAAGLMQLAVGTWRVRGVARRATVFGDRDGWNQLPRSRHLSA